MEDSIVGGKVEGGRKENKAGWSDCTMKKKKETDVNEKVKTTVGMSDGAMKRKTLKEELWLRRGQVGGRRRTR